MLCCTRGYQMTETLFVFDERNYQNCQNALSRCQEPGVLPWRLFDRSRLGHRCARREKGGRLLLDHPPQVEDATVLQALLVLTFEKTAPT